MATVLFAWLGNTDLGAMRADAAQGEGPIAAAVRAKLPTYLDLLVSSREPGEVESFVRWLKLRSEVEVVVHCCTLRSPTDFRDILEASRNAIESRLAKTDKPSLNFHFSAGTPAMGAIWLLLSQTAYPGVLIQSSPESGVQDAEIPFRLVLEQVSRSVAERRDEDLLRLLLGHPAPPKEFEDILHEARAMETAVTIARVFAVRSVPVLLLGESGTGKELFAKAIHAASTHSSGPFVPVNCGALSETLAEAELFGHVKGAFTGAVDDRPGYFEQAHKGTIFLDEVGELTFSMQVRLLRVLQEKKVRRIGEQRERDASFRVIAATHRDLQQDVASGRFREDLFHRICVGLIQLPPLRHRGGDVRLLALAMLEQINAELGAQGEPRYQNRKLSPGAVKAIMEHTWPGNVRELRNALTRAAVLALDLTITEEEIRAAILPSARNGPDAVLERPLGPEFGLEALLDEVSGHYIQRALEEAGNNKSAAARLLGFNSAQTLSNWIKKLSLPGRPPAQPRNNRG